MQLSVQVSKLYNGHSTVFKCFKDLVNGMGIKGDFDG